MGKRAEVRPPDILSLTGITYVLSLIYIYILNIQNRDTLISFFPHFLS